MFKLSFEIGGRKVDPRNIRDALESAMLRGVRDHVTKRLSGVRCPDHGSAPAVVARGRTLKELTFEVSGCCQKLIDVTEAKLRS